jgi:hypothetical protein
MRRLAFSPAASIPLSRANRVVPLTLRIDTSAAEPGLSSALGTFPMPEFWAGVKLQTALRHLIG